MAGRNIIAAAALGVASFGGGWALTSHMADKTTRPAGVAVSRPGVPGSPVPTSPVLASPVLTSPVLTSPVPNAAPPPVTASLPAQVATTTAARAQTDAVAAIANLSPAPDRSAAQEGATLAYAPAAPADRASDALATGSLAPDTALAVPDRPAPPKVDVAGLRDAIAFYRKGDLPAGDAIARTRTHPLARTALEWLAIRSNPRAAGAARITAFLKEHPDWPAADWMRRKVEEAIYGDKRNAAAVLSYFATQKPISPSGELALARAYRQSGNDGEAAKLVRHVWRENDLSSPAVEGSIVQEFGAMLTRADDKYRADKLLYREAGGAALRASERVGPIAVALAKARYAAAKGYAGAGSMLDKLPAAAKADPGYRFARIQVLRRSGNTAAAAALMLAAPHDDAAIVDGDAWWVERRLIARKLIDEGDAATAYRICAGNNAVSHDGKVEAEFHAGWIALRFLNDPTTGAEHFARAAAAAQTPEEAARAGYWQGRAAEAEGSADGAARYYTAAAGHIASYYGQLAIAKLRIAGTPMRLAPTVASGDDRNDAVKVAEVLYAIGEPGLALPLVIEGVQHLRDQSQVAAMGAVVANYRDARATLLVGKLAGLRGFALDDLAFPTFGIPGYQPMARSAGRSVVYAIARQESAFQPHVVSSAGARGLMQLMPATARITAARAGIGFNDAWLISDPSFNAKLGAAHLGSLLDAQNGSYILTFAAYNAGEGAVKRWIAAYGDPRNPEIDPVDWVELIPFTETRHYVQIVMENMEVYQLRFGERSATEIDRDLRHTGS